MVHAKLAQAFENPLDAAVPLTQDLKFTCEMIATPTYEQWVAVQPGTWRKQQHTTAAGIVCPPVSHFDPLSTKLGNCKFDGPGDQTRYIYTRIHPGSRP